MKSRFGKALEVLIALFLSLTIFTAANWVSDKAHNSSLLAQSRVFKTLMEQEDSLDILNILKDSNKRKIMEKFTAALTNAYVSFEMIPFDQGKTLNALLHSIDDTVVVDTLTYHGRNLEIVGMAESYTDFQKFVIALESSEVFSDVLTNHTATNPTETTFSVTCMAKVQSTYPELFADGQAGDK